MKKTELARRLKEVRRLIRDAERDLRYGKIDEIEFYGNRMVEVQNLIENLQEE